MQGCSQGPCSLPLIQRLGGTTHIALPPHSPGSPSVTSCLRPGLSRCPRAPTPREEAEPDGVCRGPSRRRGPMTVSHESLDFRHTERTSVSPSYLYDIRMTAVTASSFQGLF